MAIVGIGVVQQLKKMANTGSQVMILESTNYPQTCCRRKIVPVLTLNSE
jgi:hypothetical protein